MRTGRYPARRGGARFLYDSRRCASLPLDACQTLSGFRLENGELPARVHSVRENEIYETDSAARAPAENLCSATRDYAEKLIVNSCTFGAAS